jgi:hypothetical protein
VDGETEAAAENNGKYSHLFVVLVVVVVVMCVHAHTPFLSLSVLAKHKAL